MKRLLNGMESSGWPERMLLLLFFGGLLGLATDQLFSYDIFWQLQSGRYMVETGRFLYADTFSLAAEVFRFEHCWLHDIIVYGIYQWLGYPGISILKGVLVTGTAAVLVAIARVRASSWPAILLVAPAVVLMTFWAWNERPQLWTFLLFSLFLWVLEKHRRDGGGLVYWLLPLMVLWSNLHAAAILAFPLMAAYLVGDCPLLPGRNRQPWADYRRLLLVTALLPLATLMTPYGLEILRTLVSSSQLGERFIHVDNLDWKPTRFAGYPLYFYALAGAAVVMALGWKRLTGRDLCLLFGLAVMGLQLERHTPFFFFALAGYLPRYLDSIAAWVTPHLARWRRPGYLLTLLAALALGLYWAQPAYRYHGFFNTGLRTWHYPIKEADFVLKEQLPGQLFNSFSAGGYLMWRLFPDYRVFWDGRQSSDTLWQQGLTITYARAGWQQLLDEHGINTVVTDVCSQIDGRMLPLVDRLRSHPAWAAVFGGESHLVFVRRAAVSPDWLRQHELTPRQVDDTVLSAAFSLGSRSPVRAGLFYEIARVYLARQDWANAEVALQRYLALIPDPEPQAVRYYRQLQRLRN